MKRGSFLEVLGIFTRLGLTSFGGPVAHLGYFREEFVTRRKWVDERTYADLNGWMGALIALVGIFLPSFLLLIGILPFWNALRRLTSFQAALRGINAGVVGLLLAALYQPVWTSTIKVPSDFILALLAFGLLVLWKCPPWLVVLLLALIGAGLSIF